MMPVVCTRDLNTSCSSGTYPDCSNLSISPKKLHMGVEGRGRKGWRGGEGQKGVEGRGGGEGQKGVEGRGGGEGQKGVEQVGDNDGDGWVSRLTS